MSTENCTNCRGAFEMSAMKNCVNCGSYMCAECYEKSGGYCDDCADI